MNAYLYNIYNNNLECDYFITYVLLHIYYYNNYNNNNIIIINNNNNKNITVL